jgi:nitrogen fixation protein NifB
MRHCRQCRADAVGLLGEDRGQAFQLSRLPDEVAYDPSGREAYRAWVAGERQDRRQAAARARAQTEGAVGEQAAPLLVAVCSRGGGRINQHFGHATEFQVFEVDARGVRFVGHRRTDKYCLGGQGDDDRLAAAITALEGVPVVLSAKIGSRPKRELATAGIEALDTHPYEYIETAVSAVYRDRQGRAAATAAVA